MAKYEFAEQGSSRDDGFNDGGTIQFDHDIPKSVSRESIQNILDARDVALGRPALAKFDLLYIKPKDVLEQKQFLKILKSCLASSEENPQSSRFFTNAIQHLESHREIPVLRISDYNTDGLTGDDDDPRGNYRNFLKAAGSTNKSGNSGGSFGLGKAALIAASFFRTIFVASSFGNKKASGNLFQGMCCLISHETDGIKYRGIGSFGLKGEKPIRDKNLIPPQYCREENGTDIYILGLRGHKHWKEDMTREILAHFWRAIQKGILEVEIEGIKIDSENIEKKLFEVFEMQDVYKKNEINPIPFYLAYKKGQLFEGDFPTIGKVQCRILPGAGYPNQMYCVRSTGMRIEQRDFRSVVQYAGVFECDNEKGDNVFKLLEPPNHNEWSLDNPNAKDPEGEPLPEAKKAHEEFYRFCRDSVSSLVNREDRKALSIHGLEKYLNLPSPEEEVMEAAFEAQLEKSKISERETGSEVAFMDESRPVVTPPRKLVVTNKQDLGSLDGGKASTLEPGIYVPPPRPGGGGGTAPGTSGSKTGSEGDGDENIWLATDAKHRAFATSKNGGKTQHVIVIRGAKKKEYSARLMAGTDDNFLSVPIQSAVNMDSKQKLPFTDNLISEIKTDSSGEARIGVEFEDGQQYALNVGVYEGK